MPQNRPLNEEAAAADMLFNFKLRTIEDIASTGVMLNSPPAESEAPAQEQDRVYLNWYRLTDGWFWVDCGGQELFRYSDPILEFWNSQGPSSDPPYVCHPVIQLLFDLCDIIPDVLEPVPSRILQTLEPGGKAYQWGKRIEELACSEGTDECIYEQYLKTVLWVDRRRLDAVYLSQNPKIWFWNDGSTMHIQWYNEGLDLHGHQPWDSIRGGFQMAFEEFMNELSSFNGRLLEAMEKRMGSIERSWNHSEVELDRDELRQSQEANAAMLSRSLEQARTSEKTAWDEVAEAIRFFEVE